jgi:hypothetical protein
MHTSVIVADFLAQARKEFLALEISPSLPECQLLFFPNHPITRKPLACSSARSGIASFRAASKRRK